MYGDEIDLMLAENGILYPIAVKKRSHPQRKDVEVFNLLDMILGVAHGPDGEICLSDRLFTFHGAFKAIPVGYLL